MLPNLAGLAHAVHCFLVPPWLSQHFTHLERSKCLLVHLLVDSDTGDLIWEEQNRAYVLDSIHPQSFALDGTTAARQPYGNCMGKIFLLPQIY